MSYVPKLFSSNNFNAYFVKGWITKSRSACLTSFDGRTEKVNLEPVHLGSKSQWSAVQLSAMQCSAVHCSSVKCIAVQLSAVKCIAVQLSAMKYSAMKCISLWWHITYCPSLMFFSLSSDGICVWIMCWWTAVHFIILLITVWHCTELFCTEV